MFGVDLGINLSSITLIAGEKKKHKILDYRVIYGPSNKLDMWNRVVQVADATVDMLTEMVKAKDRTIIKPLIALEEPVYSPFNKNARAAFIIAYLHALIRNKLEKRGWKVYAVHPLSVKAIAKKQAFGRQKVKGKYLKGRNLSKIGMIRAFKILYGFEPPFKNRLGRETLADSCFIARTGFERRKMKLL